MFALVYFYQHVFSVEDGRRLLYAVAIPAKAEDCYDLIEYLGYDSMIEIINKFGYDIIQNPHVNRFNLGKIIPESYRIPKSKIYSFELLTIHGINLTYPLMQIELTPYRFKPHYRYENMSNAQIQFIIYIFLTICIIILI
jgi:hypothetical protein